MIELKKGDIVKHFEGTNLIEKDIFQIIAVNPSYTGTKNFPEEAVVIYESLFHKDKTCVVEYSDFIRVLDENEIRLSGNRQKHFVEPLSEEELVLLKSPTFIRDKEKYLIEKEQQSNNSKKL